MHNGLYPPAEVRNILNLRFLYVYIPACGSVGRDFSIYAPYF